MSSNDQTGELQEIANKMQGCANYLSNSWFEVQRMAQIMQGLGPTLQELTDKVRDIAGILQERQIKEEDDLK